jgi:hypothetical protein
VNPTKTAVKFRNLVQTARIGGFLFFDQWTLLSLRYKEARPKLVGLKSEKNPAHHMLVVSLYKEVIPVIII